ncbi:MAG: AAA family ATPase [Desulfobacterales bacterium]|nr:AAA family ATPase [Desulfobacterales bacterium]
MISEIRLINYKKFLCERIPLDPITVFIGPNGAGKSTIASALHTIAAIMRLGLKSAFPEGFFSFDRVINYHAEKIGYKDAPIGFGISVQTDSLNFDYDIIFCRDLSSPSGFIITYEGLKIKSTISRHYSFGKYPEFDSSLILPTKGGDNLVNEYDKFQQRDSFFIESENAFDEKELFDDDLLEEPAERQKLLLNSIEAPESFREDIKKIKRYMQRIRKYQFSPLAARKGYEQYDGSGQQPFLKQFGGNLSVAVQYLLEERRDLLIQLKEWVIKYAEGESKIVDVGVATYDNKVFLNFYEEGKERKSFPIRGPLISDGYWVFAAFACLASCEIIPSVAFFEEPESHLHPHKLPILYEIFKSIAKREKDPCQVLISSHSPYFLDLFKEYPDSVILLNQGKAKRLTDIDDYEDILSLYSIGEAWYSNIFDWGNP